MGTLAVIVLVALPAIIVVEVALGALVGNAIKDSADD